jgi:DnaK suppressor protein
MPKNDKPGPRARVKSYEKILRAKKEEVRRNLSAHNVAHTLRRQEHAGDEGDLSQRSYEEFLFLNRNNLEIKLLREVEQALIRVRNGEFGVCHRCEEAISPKRLDAIPWAKYCVPCQEHIARTGDLPEDEHETNQLEEADL